MNNSKVALAAASFSNGNYVVALELYKSLALQMGEHLFAINIKLCEIRIKKNLLNDSQSIKFGKKNSKISPENISIKLIDSNFVLISNANFELVEAMNVPSPGATLEFSAAIVPWIKNTDKAVKIILLFDFFDDQGKLISNLPGIGLSSAFKKHFRYLTADIQKAETDLRTAFKLKFPDNIFSFSVTLTSVGLKVNDQIDISIQGRCYNEEVEREIKLKSLQRQALPDPVVHELNKKRYTSSLTVACILDEFTSECLKHEVKLIKLTQEDWQTQIEENSPDFLLVESCWKGNDGNWGALTKGSGGGRKLSALLDYCKQQSIATVFWNKEDPPHYEKFGPIAKFFDLAITTDVNMVLRYKNDFGIDVYPLSFGAQPKIHNPRPIIKRVPKAVFAGSYYGDKPKRCEDFNEVMQQLEQVGYDIFDRNFQKGIDKFAFPVRYQPRIVGNLLPEEVWKAHKGYKYQVNLNSVQDSATMFARRVYESLASGTPVISNDSLGVRELFGDIVIMSGEQSIADQLSVLEASPDAYQLLARRGVRAVMRDHTYGHRIQSLCHLLGIDVEVELPKVTLAMIARSEADISHAKQLFAAQTAKRKHLFIELANFDTAYQFLNMSDETVTYAMKLAHEFYADENQYYGSDCVLWHDVNSPLAAEALEDFIYWGAGEVPFV